MAFVITTLAHETALKWATPKCTGQPYSPISSNSRILWYLVSHDSWDKETTKTFQKSGGKGSDHRRFQLMVDQRQSSRRDILQEPGDF